MNRKTILQIVTYFILSIWAIFFLFPFYWMVISSIKPNSELFTYPPNLIPIHFTLDNFINVATKTHFLQNFVNSIIVAVPYIVISVFFCSLCGYAFAKMNFPGRNFLFGIVIATMSLPFEITLVPLYKLMTNLHWTNTYLAVILPFVASAWGVFLMRQSMLNIPDALLDAARIDGASEFRIYFQIVLPVSAPALGALGILQFLDSWNMYIWPLIVLTENRMMTLPIALASFKSGFYANYAGITAGSFLSTIPIIIIFLVFQKFFVRGALFGSVKE